MKKKKPQSKPKSKPSQKLDIPKSNEPFVYGETLNTDELIKGETDKFLNYTHENAHKNKNPHELLTEFSQTRNWGKDEFAGSYASDLKAVWDYHTRFIGSGYYKVSWKTPEGKREIIILKYEKYKKQKGLAGTPISKKQLEQIDYWSDKRDKILEAFSEGKGERVFTNQGYGEWIKKAKPIFDGFFKAYGMKPCKASDCPNSIGKGKIYYCSDRCKGKEKTRRRRAAHPKEDKKSKLKYLKFLEEEGDI